MQAYVDWTLDVIRKNGQSHSWLEERRLEWVPLAIERLKTLLDGRAFLVITDDEREWFLEYVISKINRSTSNRPLLPFVSLKSFYPNLNSIKTNEDRDLLEDMLSMVFPNGYIFFYIGKANHIHSQIATRREDSFIWMLDERLQNGFYLNSKDKELDVKLIQLYSLMDRTIDALLFSEV